MVFQNKINLNPSQGWNGDFASVNSRVSLLSKDGTFQVGETSITAGSFVWIDEQQSLVSNQGTGSPVGFVGRELTETSMDGMRQNNTIFPPVAMVTIFSKGEFLIILPETIDAIKQGDPVFVTTETGKIVASSNKSSVTTNYKYAENTKGGDLVKISAWI